MGDLDRIMMQKEAIERRLADSEKTLSKTTLLADRAYISLSYGDLESCEKLLTEIIQSTSNYFYEELH